MDPKRSFLSRTDQPLESSRWLVQACEKLVNWLSSSKCQVTHPATCAVNRILTIPIGICPKGFFAQIHLRCIKPRARGIALSYVVETWERRIMWSIYKAHQTSKPFLYCGHLMRRARNGIDRRLHGIRDSKETLALLRRAASWSVH